MPTAAAPMSAAALAVLLLGNGRQPGGYAPRDVPDALYGVIADLVR
ncbi:hypothetical protein [Salipiger bermudensis]|nr:hypothetical protein [Salipiger bermudensis]MCA0963749.1 hypothetical protein [Salipiger bermudensis]